MRFNKKRGWTIFNRPLPDKEETVNPDEVVVMEQESLPSEAEMEEESMSAPVEEPVQLSGDPIQHLFSTLGKFNRHMSQAQHAPDSGDWAEKCMNELAFGLEIAIACNWTPVKDALIDTARILHSYDRVGRRRDCIPFLNNSYEILSLMVGDLIVDKVRAGVIQKWRDLYGKTLDELKHADIPLAEDEEETEDYESVEEEAYEEASVTDEPASDITEDLSEEIEEEVRLNAPEEPSVLSGGHREPEGRKGRTADAGTKRTADMPFELPPLSEPEPEDLYEEPRETYEEEPGETGSILAFPGNTADKHDAEPETEEYDDEYDEEEIPAETEEETVTGTEDARKEFSSVRDERNQEASLFDIEEEASARETEMELDLEAAEPEEDAAAPNVAVEEAAGEETSEEETSVSEEDGDDSEDAGCVPEEAGVESVPEPSMNAGEVQATLDLDAPPDAGTPQHLLRQARDAMDKGDVRSARSMALELALAMARIEFEQAQAGLARAEQGLVDNAQAIKAAQDRVEDTEFRLLQAEELLATRDGECSACRDRIAGMDEELQQFQSELNDIDAEIEALQRRRTEQVNRMENKRVEREETLGTEGRLQTEMEALRQDADGIRQDLEALREEKKNQVENKRDIEASICEAREEAESRRLSLAAIEHTLAPRAAAASAPPAGEAGLL